MATQSKPIEQRPSADDPVAGRDLVTGEAAAPTPLSKEEFERKCITAMEALREQGQRADLAAVFVRVATWELAKIVDAYGKRAMTDVLHQFAGHLDYLDDLERARREAGEAKAQGKLPQ